MVKYKRGSSVRKSKYPIDKIFLDRWSPRAMSGEPISEKELFTLFEAARWAPSASNIQPWRFIYAKQGSSEWKTFFDLLVEFNQMWAKNASVLVCLIAKKTNDKNKPNYNYMSDSGSAWENLALQGAKNNLVIHGMGGFDLKKTYSALKIPKDYQVVHIFTVGKPGKLSVLPERMQKGEKPSKRKKLSEIVFKAKFKK